jgi:SAM-dependent methyltransferase
VSQETFDRIASVYDEALPAHVVDHYARKRVRFVREHCPPGRLLDVGCGTGLLAKRLATAGYDVTGIDPSEGMLAVLAERAPEVAPVRGSATELPFEDQSFDTVISVATIHHIAAPEAVRRALCEMARVARPGGRIVVWDHNPRNPYWGPLMKRVPQDDGSERLVDDSELIAGLRAGGAEILANLQMGLVPDFVPRRLLPPAAALEAAAERTPGLRRLCAHNVIIARR